MKLKLVTALLVGTLVLSGCQLLEDSNNNTEDNGAVETSEETGEAMTEENEDNTPAVATEESSKEEVTETVSEKPNDAIEVSTDKGSLYFSDQWVDYMEVSQADKDGVSVVDFNANFDGEIIPLFTLNIGGGEGADVGLVTDNAGNQHQVLLTMHELPDLELTETEQNRLYAMQEDINYVIDHLK